MRFEITDSGDFLFIGTEVGTVEVWNIEKATRVKRFEVESNKKKLNKIIRGMILSPDESFLTVVTKQKVAYYCVKKLKEMPSKSIYEGLESEDRKLKHVCSKIEPLNSFESKEFDFINLMVDVKNTIYTVLRN